MTTVVQALSLGDPQGMQVMIKDTIDIAGAPTRAGSRALEDASPAAAHAEVVRRLLDAGCHITGKTGLHELAFGTTGINAWSGTVVNPRYPDRIPGGSSSGSAAAVAAGLADAALGTDTGGSVRVPAACCGVFGFKPSFGRVSRVGVMPAYSSIDCVGPFAPDMATLVRTMQGIAPDFGTLPSVDGITIGTVPVEAAPAVQRAVDAALAACGFALAPRALPGMRAAYDAGLTVINVETWAACKDLVAGGKVGDDIAQRLRNASLTTPEQLAAAEAVRRDFIAEVDAALQGCAVLALPTMPDFPPLVAQAADTRALIGITSLVRAFNLSGHPALSIPLCTPEGLPAGLQLVGAHGADELVCAVGAEIARRLGSSFIEGA
jgi:amidase